MCVCACAWYGASVCVCVCVCERERQSSLMGESNESYSNCHLIRQHIKPVPTSIIFFTDEGGTADTVSANQSPVNGKRSHIAFKENDLGPTLNILLTVPSNLDVDISSFARGFACKYNCVCLNVCVCVCVSVCVFCEYELCICKAAPI